MAYKISYKVVAEQGGQLKGIAKDMDQYSSQLRAIISKLGNDELLQSVRTDLNKFSKQLEEEKVVLNLAGQVIEDVIQSYSGAEKKSVQKVDRAKAHNRDFYKRPVAVASAGGAATAASATVNVNTAAQTPGGASASQTSSTVNVQASSAEVYQSTTNIYVQQTGADMAGGAGAAAAFTAAVPDAASEAAGNVQGLSSAAAAGIAAMSGMAGGVVAAAAVSSRSEKK